MLCYVTELFDMESPTVRPGRTTRIVAAVVVTTVAGILLAATFFRRRRRKSHRKKQNGAVPQKQREAPERSELYLMFRGKFQF